MATVVKKGGLDVKRKNRIGPPYKRKYVILRRNTTEGTKLVEIYDSENLESEKECITLKGIWTIQDRESQNKKRFAFELVVGAHVVMTFSCPSLLERSEWTESFRILNSISSSSPVPPMEDMYHVILEHNIYSAEIGIYGACLLRVQDGSIVLYSEDGSRKLHHWAFDNVDNISMADDQVILDAHRPGANDAPMQFRLNTDFNSSRNILIACSMLLAKDKKRLSSLSLNNVGISVTSADPIPTKSQSLSKGFLSHVKQSNKPFNSKEDKGVVRRAKSFTDKTSFSIRRSLSPDACIMGSVQSISSQEAYAINRPHSPQTKDEGSPPPIPPRAPRRPRSDTIERLDPDYSYIKDDIDGSTTRNKSTSSNGNESVDQQLDDLLRDIEEENKVKKRRQTYTHSNRINPYAEIGPSRTVKTLRPQTTTIATSSKAIEDFEKKRKEFFQVYGDRGASDYIEPVPSKTIRDKRSSSPAHYRDWCGVNGSMAKHLSSEYSTSVSHKTTSSSHDYHTIPDNPIKPSHGHTSSMDSTHTESVVINSDSAWRRTQSSSDDPPSPPLPPRPSYLTQIPPTKHVSATNRKGDISPYAIAKGIIVQSESSPALAPPLPPRSPNKYQRERISIQSTNPANNRCQKCNGVKSTRSSTVRQPHRLPPSPPLDDNGTIPHKPRPKSQPPIEIDKENMSAVYGYGSEIDSALRMLDDCVKGLTIDMDTANTSTSPKTSNASLQATNIDKAIQSAREVGSELSQVPIKRATSLLYTNYPHQVTANPYIPPRSEVSLVHGGTQTTPTRRYHSPPSASNTSTMNGSHHMPLTRYHSSMLPSELSSSTVRAHDISYN